MRMTLSRRLGTVRLLATAHLWLSLAAGWTLAGRGEDIQPPTDGVPEVLELRDPALISRIWETLYPDSLPPPGEYQVLLPPVNPAAIPGAEIDASVYLLRNGTAEGRLDRGAWEQAAAHARQEKVVRWKDDWAEPESEYIPTLWQSFHMDRERLIRWTEWPAGIRFQAGSSMSAVPAANPQFERQMDFEWDQKLYRHFLLGAALHRTEFGGGLVRSARAARYLAGGPAGMGAGGADSSKPDFWTEPFWWWSLSAGIPAARYTVFLANRPLPDLYWMETEAARLIKSGKAGDVVNQWAGGSLSHEGNVGHRMDFRLASLRYRLQWDSDAYTGALQALDLDELPAFFGRWGVGVLYSQGVAATRAWMDIPDFAFSVARPTAYPSRFHFAFLHFDMAYRNLKSFHLGVSVTMRMENPILNLPGAAP